MDDYLEEWQKGSGTGGGYSAGNGKGLGASNTIFTSGYGSGLTGYSGGYGGYSVHLDENIRESVNG
jgi:hypothetical protein